MNQRYGMKRNKSANNLTKNSINSLNKNKYYIGNSKIVANLNQRLYYNEISKKDIDYKILKEKAKQLIDDNSYENIYNKTEKGKKSTNKNLEKKKSKYSINSFRKGFDSNKKKKRQNKKEEEEAKKKEEEEKKQKEEEERKNNKYFKHQYSRKR